MNERPKMNTDPVKISTGLTSANLQLKIYLRIKLVGYVFVMNQLAS